MSDNYQYQWNKRLEAERKVQEQAADIERLRFELKAKCNEVEIADVAIERLRASNAALFEAPSALAMAARLEAEIERLRASNKELVEIVERIIRDGRVDPTPGWGHCARAAIAKAEATEEMK
jgi:hypothetical protein